MHCRSVVRPPCLQPQRRCARARARLAHPPPPASCTTAPRHRARAPAPARPRAGRALPPALSVVRHDGPGGGARAARGGGLCRVAALPQARLRHRPLRGTQGTRQAALRTCLLACVSVRVHGYVCTCACLLPRRSGCGAVQGRCSSRAAPGALPQPPPPHPPPPQGAATALAHLDALLSLAALANSPGYCRPCFAPPGSPPRLVIKGGRHPMLEAQLASGATGARMLAHVCVFMNTRWHSPPLSHDP